MRKRYLTKSRFKTGSECPRKLYYLDRKEYGNSNQADPFLKALAEGGHQVGKLAQCYFPEGVEIEERDPSKAADATEALLLRKKNVTVFEAAIRVGELLVRVDVLRKKGDRVELIEVKSKSFDSSEPISFFNKRPDAKGRKIISAEWKSYLVDVAFQTHVARKAKPKWEVTPHLYLIDKSQLATVDGLNQMFLIVNDGARSVRIELPKPASELEFGLKILTMLDVSEPVEVLLDGEHEDYGTFTEWVGALEKLATTDSKAPAVLSTACKGCEFRIDESDEASGKKSGFKECWKEAGKLKERDFARPFVFDVWNWRNAQQYIDGGRYFMEELAESDLNVKDPDGDRGMSASQRQWLQVSKVKGKDPEPYVDREGLSAEMAKVQYPLHMIDFETSRSAIPFYVGSKPNEQIAFQFSHHVMHADGRVEHRTQFLCSERGVFPNFKFVRALKAALSEDEGTIFRYSNHENSVLCEIRRQLLQSDEPDRKELAAWIETITKSGSSDEEKWEGPRSMVDLCELVKRFYYHPRMGGSNSIKKVLPAVLFASSFLREKYSRPIYGAKGGISSSNFVDFTWLKELPGGECQDPYHMLPPVFDEYDRQTLDLLFSNDELADGGAALTAYARMQFTQMSEEERTKIAAALLKYCELDTLAMVMLAEHFFELLQKLGSIRRRA